MILRRIIRLPFDFYRACFQWVADDGILLAASTAFYALFSLFPLLLILTSVLGLVLQYSPTAQDAQAEVIQMIAEVLSEHVAKNADAFMEGISDKALVGGPIGIIALFFGAIGIFAQIDSAFHRIWRVTPGRDASWFDSIWYVLFIRIRGACMLIAMGMLVIAMYLLQTVFATMKVYFVLDDMPDIPFLETLLNATTLSIISTLVLMLVFKILPKTKIRWSDAFLGGALTALLWTVVRLILMAVLTETRYSAYGVFGAVIVLMMWFYIASGLFYLGAEYVRIIGVDEDEIEAMKEASRQRKKARAVRRAERKSHRK